MSDSDFTAGYQSGQEHRTVTDADREAYGDYGPGDGYLHCPAAHPEPDLSCEWCSGWAEAWT